MRVNRINKKGFFMKKLSLLALSVGFATSLHGEMSSTSMKFGVIEIQRIFAETSEGKEVQELLRKKQNELSSQLQKEGAAYMEKRQEFEKHVKEGLMSKAALDNKRIELEAKENELKAKEAVANREFEMYQQDLQQKRMMPFRDRIKTTIEAQAKKNGLTAIFVRETGETIYADPSIDLTTNVISQLDEQFKPKSAKAADTKSAGCAAKPAGK
jgi:Skp family chaperone for outer membrane proteins